MKQLWVWVFLFSELAHSQVPSVPPYYVLDRKLSRHLHDVIVELGLDGDFPTEDGPEQISLAVIEMKSKPRFGGVHYDNFIYPASIYKMYVAAEVLRQISEGKLSLWTPHVAKFPNIRDTAREIFFDPRPLLQDGDTVTVNYLLELMITRSDNSAANCLIDIVRRENINDFMHQYGWHGSEVTRKFLPRQYEDAEYQTIRGTETCALHAADFLYRIYTDQLVNPWVSMQLKTLLGRQLDKSKLAAGLPAEAMFYHKTGWYAEWTHDVGIVDDGEYATLLPAFCRCPKKWRLKNLSRWQKESTRSCRREDDFPQENMAISKTLLLK